MMNKILLHQYPVVSRLHLSILTSSLAIFSHLACFHADAQSVKKSRLYVFEKRADKLFLIVRSTNKADNKVIEYVVEGSNLDISDTYALNWSYFMDDSSFLLNGNCLINITRLIKNANYLSCLPRRSPNRTFGRIPKTNNLRVLDSTNFEDDMSFAPYYLNFYTTDLGTVVGKIKIDNDKFSILKSERKHKFPNYLAFNQFVLVDKSIDFSFCKIKVADFRNHSMIDIDTIDLLRKTEGDTTDCYFSYSMEWVNSSELTYPTGKVVNGLFRKILVWKYDVETRSRKLIYSFNVDIDWRRKNNIWTDKYKVHVYGDDIMFVDDHLIYLNPNNNPQTLYRTKNAKDMIVDAILVR
jgi:hypothetical protein